VDGLDGDGLAGAAADTDTATLAEPAHQLVGADDVDALAEHLGAVVGSWKCALIMA
jgi:hypothetical protein